MLAYGSGLRIGEIANLRVKDIDSKNISKRISEINNSRSNKRTF